MSEHYFINQKIVTLEESMTLERIDLEPTNLLSGRKLSQFSSYINIILSENSGDNIPDIISSVITLYSAEMKACLENCTVTNINYYPVNFIDSKANKFCSNYCFAHTLNRIECMDVAKLNTRLDAIGKLKLQSFLINEQGRLVIIHERIQRELKKANLKGVILENTRNYDGHGM